MSSTGVCLKLEQPRSCSTRNASPKRARSPASGETGGNGDTRALPPPWIIATAGVRADHREQRLLAVVGRRAERQHRVAVAQQHEALGRGPRARPRGRRDRRSTARVRSRACRDRRCARAARSTRRTLSSSIASVDLARAHGVGELRAEPLRRARHLEVEPGVRGGHRAVRPVPVRHDHAVEAPLVACSSAASSGCSLQYVPCTRLYAVITDHVSGLEHRGLERHERDLAQRALVDLGADRHALELGVVRDEVLHRAPDARRLHAADVRDRHAAPTGTGPRSSTRSCGRRADGDGC